MKKLVYKVKNLLFDRKDDAKKSISIDYSPVRIAQELGWSLSRELHSAINKDGEPLPWITYPAIEYLNQLDLRSKTVLEYGSGNSSLYFSRRVKSILSIEHNLEWYSKLKIDLAENQSLIHASEELYAEAPLQQNKKFDIIIIDGIKREECVAVCFKIIEEGGMILLDNSERYPNLCEKIRNDGYLQIDFHGMGPINRYTWTTSLFFSAESIGRFLPLSLQPLKPKGGESN
jgi:hypothetical protein